MHNSHTHTHTWARQTNRYRCVSHHEEAQHRWHASADMWIYGTHTDATPQASFAHTCTFGDSLIFFRIYKWVRISVVSLETFLFKLWKHHFRLVVAVCSERKILFVRCASNSEELINGDEQCDLEYFFFKLSVNFKDKTSQVKIERIRKSREYLFHFCFLVKTLFTMATCKWI